MTFQSLIIGIFQYFRRSILHVKLITSLENGGVRIQKFNSILKI